MHQDKGPGGDLHGPIPALTLFTPSPASLGHDGHQSIGEFPDHDLAPVEPPACFFLQVEEILGDESWIPSWKDPHDLKWSEARRYVLGRDNRTCAIHSCREGEDLTVHHILPRAWGGTHHPGNLVTLCTRCHRNLCTTCTRTPGTRVPPLFLPP